MRWLRHFIHKKGNKDIPNSTVGESLSPEPPLPSLAPSITLSPESWKPIHHQTQGFFALPREVRLQILHEAFGGGTIHIDMRYRRPLHTLQTSGGRGPHHGGYPPLVYCNEPPAFPPQDYSHDRAWRWYSCICHRVPPTERRVWIEPHMDMCLQGGGNCEFWPGAVPDKCRIGAMGFLLSSRQRLVTVACDIEREIDLTHSYDELLSILYSTNTIYLQGQQLIHGLFQQGLPNAPRVIGPGINLVTSLEMRWDLTLFGTYNGSQEEEHRLRFQEYLDQMPITFPNLKRLYLVFEMNLYYKSLDPARNTTEIDTVLLQPLLMIRNKIKLDEFFVSIPTTVFDAIRRIAPGRAPQIRYPFTATSENESSNEGYWLREGVFSNLDWWPDGSTFLHSHQPAHVGGF